MNGATSAPVPSAGPGPANRPVRLVACVGTATEVGKTWVGAAVLTHLRRRGTAVAARKPAESFDADALEPLDSQVLAEASGEAESEVTSPHRRYPVALAPPMAARRLGVAPPQLSQVLAELSWPVGCGVGWLETVGGVRSPIAVDADSRDLVAAVRPDRVVLVGDASLGTIGAVRSALDSLALGATGGGSLADRTVVILNRFDRHSPTHAENLAWLVEHLAQPVVTEASAIADLLVGTAR